MVLEKASSRNNQKSTFKAERLSMALNWCGGRNALRTELSHVLS
jgi:hypothetical protein